MKVLQLSTGHTGGAGLAARRLNSALLEAGIDSTFISLENQSFMPGKHEVAVQRSYLIRFFGGALALFQRRMSKKILFSSFSLPSLRAEYLLHLSPPGDTIVQVHNWQNMLNEEVIQELVDFGYKVVLTLHDQRVFTGGCHYSFDCEGFQKNCSNCPLIPKVLNFIPRRVLNQTRIAKLSTDSIRFIGPSNWIVQLASKSTVLSDYKGETIPNVLGQSWYEIVSKLKFRKNESFTIGVASMDPTSYVKGGDLVADLEKHTQGSGVVLIKLADFTLGREAEFWEQIDCLFVPSRIDNSPNVIHEAKSLGIPVLASSIGGIPEILDHNDLLFDPISVNMIELMLLVNNLKNRSRESSLEISQLMANILKRDHGVVQQHLALYSAMLSNG
jgi:glycosyltransferase involved in cell wall biosynthesis